MTDKFEGPPSSGSWIGISSTGKPDVPERPIVGFIEGDGVGPDIWSASKPVFDSAVSQAYNGERQIVWWEIPAGEKCFNTYGEHLPAYSLEAIERARVAIKGPLTTPVGGGLRSLNVTLRQKLDLYACVRPVQFLPGTPGTGDKA
jgi:isocitrate dehydrogenase